MSLSIFIAVTHLLGAGHLTRAAALGRTLAAAGHRVTLVSGGMPARLVPKDGLDFVQLPPVRALSEDFGRLGGGEGREIGPDLLEERRRQLLAAYARVRPDVLITELYPFGRRVLTAEFQALLAAAKEARPLTLCSVRDILVAPVKAGRVEAAHRVLAENYDGILVHGDPRLVPLEASWPWDPGTPAKLIYTGYLDAGADLPRPTGLEPVSDQAAPILVSGGSSEAALPLYRAALGAALLLPDRPWHILVGAGVDEGTFAALRREAPAQVTVERARSDFRRLVAGATAFVGLAGYNTILDLFAARARAVLVPFERGRETEQRLRAERLAAAGLARLLPEAELNPTSLAAQVHEALAMDPPSPGAIDCGGAEASVRIIEELAARHRPDTARGQTAAALPAPALLARYLPTSLAMRIKADLDRLADGGRTLPLWWRDDDAVAATPALDRLLALADEAEMPVGIAAIPARVDRSLASRIGRAADSGILVHGFSHANHGPEGVKKAEFGPHRPLAAMVEEAAEGRRRIRALFGAQALDVFVPPWNRISAELAAALPALGYVGLSAAPSRTTPGAIEGLATVHAELDPIAWHGGGGFLDETAFAALWDSALTTRHRNAGTGPEPIGLLTHHLVMSDGVWGFCSDFLQLLRRHPAVSVPPLAKLWATASTSGAKALAQGT